MTATDEGLLRRALAGPDEPGTLARAALVAARHCNPALDIEHYVARDRFLRDMPSTNGPGQLTLKGWAGPNASQSNS